MGRTEAIVRDTGYQPTEEPFKGNSTYDYDYIGENIKTDSISFTEQK